jgi:alpha-L-fucosidase
MKTSLKSKTGFLALLCFLTFVTISAQQGKLPIAEGPYKLTDESLMQYKYPDWFRDAKFGIWAHWGPQAVPRQGDWYARRMYQEKDPAYKYHIEHYGHPSVFGYKDIIPLWKAEKWDPDKLMALYKKTGAKYFVSMGTHHDNFFLWNSKIHKWNAVNMGPKKDVVGTWQEAAKNRGLNLESLSTWGLAIPGSRLHMAPTRRGQRPECLMMELILSSAIFITMAPLLTIKDG